MNGSIMNSANKMKHKLNDNKIHYRETSGKFFSLVKQT